MAGRPRTPATILELRGSFKRNPGRKRIDPEGAGPFNEMPPAHLAKAHVPAWRRIVERLPKIALSSSDEVAAEVCAVMASKFWESGDVNYAKELRQWLAKFGMTPADRMKLPGRAPTPDNPFSKL